MPKYILSIDQGTTSSRAVIFDDQGNPQATHQEEFDQIFPHDGWVEHDAQAIWSTTIGSCQRALKKAKIAAADLSCIGITNQRETTIVWDRVTGEPIYNAIVWQDRRTSDYCSQLKAAGQADLVREKTGLLIDSYFSATKLQWILENVANGRERANKGELAFGTVDSFILWRLTNGKSHCTDATNASRTMLFNIHTQQWDEELLSLFDIPKSILPEVKDSSAEFGLTDADVFTAQVPITGILGDQQAAAFGQGCFEPGMTKSTYGTGCFVLVNTGEQALISKNQLLTTIAYRINGTPIYALEGSIFMAGAIIQWLRDGIGLIEKAEDTEALARESDDESNVYLVPAFTGLGAPYWDADARGALYGLNRGTGVKEIVMAALMSVCYQTKDLMEAMSNDGAVWAELRVDGGMVANDFFVQKLSDILDCQIQRPSNIETTALGAAYAAGLQVGIFESLEAITEQWQKDSEFTPSSSKQWRDSKYDAWLDAVKRTRSDAFK